MGPSRVDTLPHRIVTCVLRCPCKTTDRNTDTCQEEDSLHHGSNPFKPPNRPSNKKTLLFGLPEEDFGLPRRRIHAPPRADARATF